jgi:TMEM189-like protein
VVGPSLVKPFRMHHLYPRDICAHNIVETVGNVCILAVPILSVCLYLLWVMPESSLLAFAVICVALMAAATVATNQFHKWAHQESPSAFARWLQRKRLVLGPSHHKLHHTEPFNRHCCITNGWLNPLLNKLKFFRRLEATLRFLGIETAATDERHSRRGRNIKNQAAFLTPLASHKHVFQQPHREPAVDSNVEQQAQPR